MIKPMRPPSQTGLLMDRTEQVDYSVQVIYSLIIHAITRERHQQWTTSTKGKTLHAIQPKKPPMDQTLTRIALHARYEIQRMSNVLSRKNISTCILQEIRQTLPESGVGPRAAEAEVTKVEAQEHRPSHRTTDMQGKLPNYSPITTTAEERQSQAGELELLNPTLTNQPGGTSATTTPTMPVKEALLAHKQDQP
ncbi:hypothetical protein CHS0354_035566 [Potamilus streckersoni]|uniref:Uncharacterized protein n=1 Tax=Potamilus streckersoni TaxID=2493646 RepID=A0AAE0RST9_9BIVA|nr:hypothetical protein CHS0354_035566 [Potamilus streckersoni]